MQASICGVALGTTSPAEWAEMGVEIFITWQFSQNYSPGCHCCWHWIRLGKPSHQQGICHGRGGLSLTRSIVATLYCSLLVTLHTLGYARHLEFFSSTTWCWSFGWIFLSCIQIDLGGFFVKYLPIKKISKFCQPYVLIGRAVHQTLIAEHLDGQ